eukprot:15474611-Alexandrium_andersonii.AAC.2
MRGENGHPTKSAVDVGFPQPDIKRAGLARNAQHRPNQRIHMVVVQFLGHPAGGVDAIGALVIYGPYFDGPVVAEALLYPETPSKQRAVKIYGRDRQRIRHAP